MPKVGQIGLGVIGRLYVNHLLKEFGAISVYDADPSRVRDLDGAGAQVQSTAREVGESSQVVVLALPSPDAVKAAMTGADGLLAGCLPGTIVLDMSTIDPETSVQMYDEAKASGVSYLDAPISGGAPQGAGTDGAKAANVTFMVGGDRDAFEKARPVMQVLGSHFFYLGASGMGSTIKLLSNQISGLINLICAETFALGAAAGLDPSILLETFGETDADSYFMQNYLAPRIQRKDYEPGFSVDLMYKDHRLAGQLGQKLGVPLLFNEMATQVYQMMRAQGLGKKDLAEAVNFWGRLSGTDIYAPEKKS